MTGVLERINAVGTKADDQLAWLHRFCSADVSSAAARDSLVGNLSAMLVLRYRGWAGSSFNAAVDLQGRLEAGEIPNIQQAVRELLAGLIPGQITALPVPAADGVVWRKNRGIAIVTRTHGLPQVLSAVVDLLIEVGSKLQRCPGCGRLFAMGRPGQKFCSRQCGTRDRVTRWRLQNAERHSANRHGQYVRKVKTKYPKARVARRRKG
jgi:hypothetical protein